MTDTLVAVEPSDEHDDGIVEVPADRSVDELEVARELVRQAREAGVRLTGPDGLLKAMTKTVLETALDEEMSEHLGYDKHDQRGRGSGNSRNGSRSKTVLTDACGQVEIDVPRDRAGTFEPQIVKKRQRRLTDVDEVVLSLYARGLTTGEISAHFADIYGAAVSKDTISRITDRVLEEMATWHARPLERVYAAVFIDAIHVKIRDGQVGPRPIYAAIGVDLAGHRDVLGMWAGEGDGESAKYWLAVLTELKNRGVADILNRPGSVGGSRTCEGWRAWQHHASTVRNSRTGPPGWHVKRDKIPIRREVRSSGSPISSESIPRRCAIGFVRPRSTAGSARAPRVRTLTASRRWSGRTVNCGERTRS